MIQIRGNAIGTASKDHREDVRLSGVEYWRISIVDSNCPEEICTTHNVSRCGLYFATSSKHYVVGMNLRLIRSFNSEVSMDKEEMGEILRVDSLKDNKVGVAVRILKTE